MNRRDGANGLVLSAGSGRIGWRPRSRWRYTIRVGPDRTRGDNPARRSTEGGREVTRAVANTKSRWSGTSGIHPYWPRYLPRAPAAGFSLLTLRLFGVGFLEFLFAM